MGIFSLKNVLAKQNVRRVLSASDATKVPKGHLVVYVGETERKRFVVPITFLKHPSFLNMLRLSEEEFRYDHPTGGLTVHCREEAFVSLVSKIYGLV
ncbi:hypothetical protein QQ045_011927 [Rhodiola kirilowii]